MQHLAIIMDGNRRWAREKKLEAVTLGYKRGVDTVRIAIQFCVKKGIRYLSLYAFSLENFKRDQSEKTYIFNTLTNALRDEVDELVEQGVRIKFVGDRSFFPENSCESIEEVEERTKDLDRLQVNVLFCYGAKQELIFAAKELAKKVASGALCADEINEDSFRQAMWLGDVPDPEMIIRTGKVARLSNFLLFQGAYSELRFLDCHWPEITEEHLEECVKEFFDVKRNFGR